MISDKFYLSDEEKNDALKDDEHLEEQVFNEKDYNTIILERVAKEEDATKKETKLVLDVEKFLDQYKNPKEKDDLLIWLKQNNYKQLLLDQIQTITDKDTIAILVASYWEAGFNDNNDLLIFVPFLLSNHFNLTLEANSAIIGLNRPFNIEHVHTALQMIEDAYPTLSPETVSLVNDVVEILKTELSTNE